MTSPQFRVVKWTLFALVGINLWGALPTLYYAPYSRANASDISVYTGQGSDALPIMEVLAPKERSAGQDAFRDTGGRVLVYIRNEFRHEQAQLYCLIDLATLGVGLLFFRLRREAH